MNALSKLGYVVMSLALIVAGFGSIFRWGGDVPPTSNDSLWLILGTLALGLGPLPFQVRRDRHAAAVFCGIFGAIGMLPGIVSSLMGGASTRTLSIAGVCAVFTVVAIGWLVKSQFGKDEVPNLLVEKFGRQGIFECGGVQVAIAAAGAVRVGEVLAVHAHVQNCWSGPRTFMLGLEPVTGSAHLHRRSIIELQPLEVAVLTVPCVAAVVGKLELNVLPSASGSEGARVRRWVAPTFEGSSAGMKLAAAAGGMLLTGGGLTLKIIVAENDRDPVALPPATTQSTWLPAARAG